MTIAELIELLNEEPADAEVQAYGTSTAGRGVWGTPNLARDTDDDGRRVLFLDGDPQEEA